ncbi:Enolase [Phytophthora cinnamomi]|uniref:Enolase n=1 Tax=Phytophthora cinnamomi TaxID=4785 RepID=UPI003559B443|nr:Enolase [Phytophthora cinnamomi]
MPRFSGTKDDDVADYLFSAKLYFESKNIKNFLHSVTQFEELLTSEFTTPDRQEHLRDQLLRLRQNNFTCLEDYVSAFRHIICKVEDMSDIDKVMHFQKGLCSAGAPRACCSQHFADLIGNKNLVLPVPSFNVINGGSHAGNKLAFQEFMLPTGAESFSEAMVMGCEVYHQLERHQEEVRPGRHQRGDEGGFAPNIQSNREGVESS